MKNESKSLEYDIFSDARLFPLTTWNEPVQFLLDFISLQCRALDFGAVGDIEVLS